MGNVSVFILRIDVEPDMRILPLDKGYDALERNRLVSVELTGKRMMR